MPPEEVLDAFARSPASYVLVTILGSLFGSFANVCIYRWPPSDEHPRGRSIVRPGSHCSACGKPVRWYDNVPILAYLWLGGRCRDCGAEFSARYLLVEAAMGMLFFAVYYQTVGLGIYDEALSFRMLHFLVYSGFCFVLVVITFIDIDHQLILDKITYPAIPIFYTLGNLLPEREWTDGLLGAAIGYAIVRIISDGYYLLTRREGLGYGDGKLLAIIGALFGWKAVVTSLFVGSLIGSVIGIAVLAVARARRRAEEDARVAEEDAGDEGEAEAEGEGGDVEERDEVPLHQTPLPFGPFLAAGALVYLFAHTWLDIRFAY